MRNYWGDFMEMVGDAIIPTLTKGLGVTTNFLRSLTETDFDRTISQLKEYGISAEKIIELEKIGLQMSLIETEAELKKINQQGLSREEIQNQINGRIERQGWLVNELFEKEKEIANYKIEREKAEQAFSASANINTAQALAREKSKVELAERQADSIQLHIDRTSKLIGDDKERIDLLIEIEKLTAQISASGGATVPVTPAVDTSAFGVDLEKSIAEAMKSVRMPSALELPAARFRISAIELVTPEVTDELLTPMTDQLAKFAELQAQYDSDRVISLKEQQDSEIELWQKYYDNSIIEEEEFNTMKTGIVEKYSNMRQRIIANEVSSGLNAMGSLIGGIGDMAGAMGAQTALVKHFAAAEAAMNSFAAFTLQLASPPAFTAPLRAAGALLSGLAQVVKINATGFQFGTEGYQVPAGNPNDSYMFAAKSGENIKVTPAGKESGSGNNKELIAEIRKLGDRLDRIQKYEIRTIDKSELSQYADEGKLMRSTF
jgi:hypothetical protein